MMALKTVEQKKEEYRIIPTDTLLQLLQESIERAVEIRRNLKTQGGPDAWQPLYRENTLTQCIKDEILKRTGDQ